MSTVKTIEVKIGEDGHLYYICPECGEEELYDPTQTDFVCGGCGYALRIASPPATLCHPAIHPGEEAEVGC